MNQNPHDSHTFAYVEFRLVTVFEPKPKTAVLGNTESKPKPQFSGG